MAIFLGENPWILILIILLEPLLIFIPAFISSKITKKPIKEELNQMGFKRNNDSLMKNMLKIITGIGFGVIFYLIRGYILLFFRDFLIENIYGTHFIIEAEKGVISTKPIRPNFLQIVIIIFLYILIIAPSEEAFFRGFVLKKIETQANTIYAILLSSLCFSFYHIPPFLVPIPTIIVFFGYYFTFGLLLAVLFKLFNYSLIPCIIAHGLFNILILML